MGRIAGIGCLLLLFCSAVLLAPGTRPLRPVLTAPAYAQASSTEIMKQSDHHRRVERAKKAQAEARNSDQQMAAFGMPESSSEGYDYLVVVLLAVSLIVIAFVARRGRRARSRP